MLNKLTTFAVIAIALSMGSAAEAQDWSRQNVFGGQDFFSNGKYQGRTTPNVFGGYNYQNASGRMIGQSSKNVFGGQNYQFGRTSGHSTPNVFGGSNYKELILPIPHDQVSEVMRLAPMLSQNIDYPDELLEEYSVDPEHAEH